MFKRNILKTLNLKLFILFYFMGVGLILWFPTNVQAYPSQIGPTGLILTPSPQIVKNIDGIEIGVNAEEYNRIVGGTVQASEMLTNFTGSIGYLDKFEYGFMRTSYSDPSLGVKSFTSIKYKTPKGFVAGAILGSGADWNSVYILGGKADVYGGFGVNVGGENFNKDRNNNGIIDADETGLATADALNRMGSALLGGYSYNNVSGVGAPDKIFFLFGISKKVGKMRLMFDYNGSRFGFGGRLEYKAFSFNLVYTSEPEEMTYINEVSGNKLFDRSSISFGGSVKF